MRHLDEEKTGFTGLRRIAEEFVFEPNRENPVNPVCSIALVTHSDHRN